MSPMYSTMAGPSSARGQGVTTDADYDRRHSGLPLTAPPGHRHRKKWADLDEHDEDGPDLEHKWSDSSSQTASEHSSARSGSASGGYKSQKKKICNKPLAKQELFQGHNSLHLNLRPAMLQPQGDQNSSLCDGYSSNGGESSRSRTSTIDSTTESSGGSGSQGALASAQDQLVSVGSARHDEGLCKPCIFVHSHLGCAQAASCEFCHFTHLRKSKANPCKDKRHRYRKLFEQQMEVIRKSGAGEAGGSSEGSLASGSGDPTPASSSTVVGI